MTEWMDVIERGIRGRDAATWDSHYGDGITQAYALIVDKECADALAALASLRTEVAEQQERADSNYESCERIKRKFELATVTVKVQQTEIAGLQGRIAQLETQNRQAGASIDRAAIDILRAHERIARLEAALREARHWMRICWEPTTSDHERYNAALEQVGAALAPTPGRTS
jgi:chromosome segregation ATPase